MASTFVYMCKKCGYNSQNVGNAYKHITQHFPDYNPYKCKHCDYRTRKSDTMMRHIRTYHPGKCLEYDQEKDLAEEKKQRRECIVKKLAIPDNPRPVKPIVKSPVLPPASRSPVTAAAEGLYQCKVCKYSTDSLTTIRRHVKRHADYKPFRCGYCTFKHAVRYNVAEHVRKTHEDQPIRVISKRSLAKEAQIDTLFVSGGAAESLSADTDHSSEGTSGASSPRVATGLSSGVVARSGSGAYPDGKRPLYNKVKKCLYKCAICGYSQAVDLVKEHLKRAHLQYKPCRCSLCDYGSVNHYAVRKHQISKHGRKGSVIFIRDPEKEKALVEKAVRLTGDNRYASVVDRMKNYRCKTCGYLGGLYELRLHTRVHLDYRPFKCRYCPMKSVRKFGVEKHMNKMHAGKPMKVVFKKDLQLETACLDLIEKIPGLPGDPVSSTDHTDSEKQSDISDVSEVRTSTTMPPPSYSPARGKKAPWKTHMYKCGICGKVARDMRTHVHRHLGYKPYKCPYCDYLSAGSSDVLGHVDQKHPHKPRRHLKVINEELEAKGRSLMTKVDTTVMPALDTSACSDLDDIETSSIASNGTASDGGDVSSAESVSKLDETAEDEEVLDNTGTVGSQTNVSSVVERVTKPWKPFYCKTCNVSFSVISTARRHLRTFHSGKGQILQTPLPAEQAAAAPAETHPGTEGSTIKTEPHENPEEMVATEVPTVPAIEFNIMQKRRRDYAHLVPKLYCSLCSKRFCTRSGGMKHLRVTHKFKGTLLKIENPEAEHLEAQRELAQQAGKPAVVAVQPKGVVGGFSSRPYACRKCGKRYISYSGVYYHAQQVHGGAVGCCKKLVIRKQVPQNQVQIPTADTKVVEKSKATVAMQKAAPQLSADRKPQLTPGRYKMYGCSMCSVTYRCYASAYWHIGHAHSEKAVVIRHENKTTVEKTLRKPKPPQMSTPKSALSLLKNTSPLSSDGKRGRKVYTCKECGYKNGDHYAMTLHVKHHINYRPYKCFYCPYCAHTNMALNRHQKNVHPGKRLRCVLKMDQAMEMKCRETFTSELKHSSSNADTSSDTTVKSESSRATFSVVPQEKKIKRGKSLSKCNICGKIGANMKFHVFRHLGYQPYQCIQCAYKSSFQPHVRRHVVNLHSDPSGKHNILADPQKEKEAREYLSRVKKGEVPTEAASLPAETPQPVGSQHPQPALGEHSRGQKRSLDTSSDSSTFEKPPAKKPKPEPMKYRCVVCGLASQWKFDQIRHCMKHLGYNPYKCPLCPYGSSKSLIVRKHLRRQHKEKKLEPLHHKDEAMHQKALEMLIVEPLKKKTDDQKAASIPAPFTQSSPRATPSPSRPVATPSPSRPIASVTPQPAGIIKKTATGDHRDVHGFEGVKIDVSSYRYGSCYQCDRCSYTGQSGFNMARHLAQHAAPRFKCLFCDFKSFICGFVRKHMKEKHALQFYNINTLYIKTGDKVSISDSITDIMKQAGVPQMSEFLSDHLPPLDSVSVSGAPPLSHEREEIISELTGLETDNSISEFDTSFIKSETSYERPREKPLRETCYCCHLCAFKTIDIEKFKDHIGNHPSPDPLRCVFCNFISWLPYEFQRHMEQHTVDKRYKCAYCGTRFLYLNDGRKHHKTKHPDLPLDITDLLDGVAMSDIDAGFLPNRKSVKLDIKVRLLNISAAPSADVERILNEHQVTWFGYLLDVSDEVSYDGSSVGGGSSVVGQMCPKKYQKSLKQTRPVASTPGKSNNNTEVRDENIYSPVTDTEESQENMEGPSIDLSDEASWVILDALGNEDNNMSAGSSAKNNSKSARNPKGSLEPPQLEGFEEDSLALVTGEDFSFSESVDMNEENNITADEPSASTSAIMDLELGDQNLAESQDPNPEYITAGGSYDDTDFDNIFTHNISSAEVENVEGRVGQAASTPTYYDRSYHERNVTGEMSTEDLEDGEIIDIPLSEMERQSTPASSMRYGNTSYVSHNTHNRYDRNRNNRNRQFHRHRNPHRQQYSTHNHRNQHTYSNYPSHRRDWMDDMGQGSNNYGGWGYH